MKENTIGVSNYEFNSLTLPSLHFVRGQAQEHQTGKRARWKGGKGSIAVLPFIDIQE